MNEKNSLIKVWLILGAFLYPLWSVLIYFFLPHEYDQPFERLILSAIYIIFLFLSYKSKFKPKCFEPLAYTLVFSMITHFYSLAYRSQFGELYQFGVFIIAGSTSFIFLSKKASVLNCIYSTLILLIVAFKTSIPIKTTYIMALGILTIHIVSMVILYVTLRLSEKIAQQRVEMNNSARLASLGEMAGGIAHEINNPLAVIHGHIAKMKRMKKKDLLTDEEFLKITDQILGVIERIVVIIKSLRKFARDDSQSGFHESQLTDIVDEVIQLTAEKLKHLEIKVEHIKPDWNTTINCREVQISQVLFNLISNSIDAIEHLDSKWIKISYEKEKNNIILNFTDSGLGIPIKNKDKILEPFFTTKPVGKGTGLGLSISHGIMMEHSGNIEINLDSINTQFKLLFPEKM